jgi:recombination protein RecT
MPETTKNLPAKQEKVPSPMATLAAALNARQTNIAGALAKRMPVTVWMLAAKSVYNKIPLLFQATEESQYQAWNNAAVMGQLPGQDVHWIPFKNGKTGKMEVVSVTDYKHIVKTAMDSGLVDDLYARVVYRDDVFEVIEGTDPKIIHKPNLTSPNRADNDIVAAYMVGKMKGTGCPHTEVMTIHELKNIQARSKAGDKPDGPWRNFFSEMVKKTVIKRGTKTMPRNLFSPEFLAALQAEDEVEFGGETIKEADYDILTPGRHKLGQTDAPAAAPASIDSYRAEIIQLHADLMEIADDVSAGDETYKASGLTAKGVEDCNELPKLVALKNALAAELAKYKK